MGEANTERAEEMVLRSPARSVLFCNLSSSTENRVNLKNWDATIYRMLGEEVRAEAVSPDSEESIPMFRADFLCSTSKSVQI